MDSNFIKTELLSYLRFTRGVKLLASECGFMSSDVLFVRNDQLYEIEIKTSWADFKNDFKKPKHDLYLGKGINESFKSTYYLKDNNGNHLRDEKGHYIIGESKLMNRYYYSIPNYFLFAVSKNLVDKAEPYLKENYPFYGLLSIDNQFRFANNTVSVIKPKNIHKRPVHSMIESTIISRMGSEIAGLRSKLYKKELKDEINEDK